MPNVFDQFDAPVTKGQSQNVFDQFDTPPRGVVEQALSPITDYPSVYAQMNRESREQMGRGIEQLKTGVRSAITPSDNSFAGRFEGSPTPADEAGAGPVSVAKGLGNIALGTAGYVGSPIAAALRTFVGKPVENITGIPKEYPEFAAGLALPIPKSLSIPGRTEKAVAPTVGQLKSAATAAYESPQVKGLDLHPTALPKLVDDIEIALGKANANDISAPITYKFLARAKEVPEGAVAVTADNLEGLRRNLGDISPIKDATGKITNGPELRAAAIARRKIDEFVPAQADVMAGDPAAAAAKLQEARGNYSAAEHADIINRKELRAELRAASANSGRNLSNTMRQRIADILLDPNQLRGFSPGEQAMMDRIVRGTKTENAIRYTGHFLGGGGGLGALVTTAEGTRALGLVGSLAAVPGAALSSLSNVLTRGNIDKLNAMIRSNSPLGRKMQPPVNNFTQTAQEFSVSPTARNFARFSIASRNLSTNLADVGITHSPDQLMRSIMGPNRSAAEQEQPQP